jgi:hypothetical protein
MANALFAGAVGVVGPLGPLGPVGGAAVSSSLLLHDTANTSANRLKMTRLLLNRERRLTRFSFKAFIKYTP